MVYSCETMEAEHQIILLIPILCLASYWEQGQFMEKQMHFKKRKEEVATVQEELVVFRDQLIAFEQTCAMVSLAKREMQYF